MLFSVMFLDKEKDRKGQDCFLSLSLAKNTTYFNVKVPNYSCLFAASVPVEPALVVSGDKGNITITDCASLVTDAIIHATGGRLPGIVSAANGLSVSFICL